MLEKMITFAPNSYDHTLTRTGFIKMTITFIIIIIILVLVFIVALLAFRKSQQLKARANECAKEVQMFHDKLQRLSDPSHLFTDEELLQVKQEYAPLIDKINELYDSLLISKEYLDDLGLKDFIRERKFLNHIQLKNNQLHM